MKYYGFKYSSGPVYQSYLNPNVGVLIGIVGSFMILILGAESNGLKGVMHGYGVFYLTHIALSWFLSYLSENKEGAKRILKILSLSSAWITLIVILGVLTSKTPQFSTFVFFILNTWIFYLANQRASLI